MNRQIHTLPQLAALFKELCRESPYTMKEVLEDAGVPEQYPSKWRKGYGRAPSYREMALMAEKLNRPVEVLIYADADPYVQILK